MPPLLPPRDAASAALHIPYPRSIYSTTTAATAARRSLEALTSRILPRLATDTDTVPEGYGRGDTNPSPGAVAGIVIGSVAAFLLLLWVIYWCVNLGAGVFAVGTATDATTTVVTEETGHRGLGSLSGIGSASVVSRHSRPRVRRHKQRHSKQSKRHSHSSQSSDRYHHHHRPRETVEFRRERVVPVHVPVAPLAPRPDQIIVEELPPRSRPLSRSRSRSLSSRSLSRSRSRSFSRPARPPPVRVPPPQRRRPQSDSDSSEEDEVVVIEEHSPPPRRRDLSRDMSRGPSRRSSDRRSGGSTYRYSGGEGGARDMNRRRSGSRR